jgi:glycosyltransferase involved in cell wall biosynthesis
MTSTGAHPRAVSPPRATAGSMELAHTRVVFVTDTVTPYMVAVFRELARLVDLHVVFCSSRSIRGMEWELDDLGFPHTIVDGFAIERGLDRITYFLSPRILTSIMRARPRALISAGFSFPTVYAATYALATRRPLVIHSDGWEYTEQDLTLKQRAAREILLRIAAAGVGNSVQSARRFEQLGVRRDRLFVAPHSTNVDRFRAAYADREPHDGAVRVLTVSRLLPRKGNDRLLKAFARAVKDEPSLHLTIVGTGPEDAKLRRLAAELGIADRVELRGFVDQPDLPAVYRSSDVFAFPTLADPFGFVLLEAAAAGLALVSSPYAGATYDLVRDGETGYVVDPDDTDALADALVRLARDPELRRRIARNAHQSTAERTPAAAARGYAAAVQASLSSRRRAIRIAGGR